MRPKNDIHQNLVFFIAGMAALALLSGAAVAYMAGGSSLRGATTLSTIPTVISTPTPTSLPTSKPAATATPSPTPTSTPSIPTPSATPTSTATPTPAQTPTQIPGPVAITDPRNDLIDFTTQQPFSAAAGAHDIQSACFSPERQLLRSLPTSLAGVLKSEDEFLALWMTLYEPLPEIPTTRANWLFALDVDANPGTGRPLGDGLINPDLGVDITLGLYSDPGSTPYYRPYFIIWNAQAGQTQRVTLPAEIHFNAARDTVMLSVSLTLLDTILNELALVAPQWELAQGRAATLATLAAGLAADFAPDLP